MKTKINAHEWMQKLRFDLFHVAELRSLRVGEQLWVGWFIGPGVTEKVKGVCEAYFVRERGGIYSFNAVWTICWGSNQRRAHVMTSGNFKLLKGNWIELLTPEDQEAEKSFCLVCRYCDFFNRNSKRLGIRRQPVEQIEHHHLWRGEIVGKNGYNRHGCPGPEIKGLTAIAETAMALGIVKN